VFGSQIARRCYRGKVDGLKYVLVELTRFRAGKWQAKLDKGVCQTLNA
jgi:hypothetical protein